MRRGTSGLNLVVGVDKPAGLSSHDVVNRVRRAVGERRVGHAGTLDPAATGVLVVGVGQGTRLMGLLTAERKSYLASIAFGTQTDTDDAEGTVIRTAEVPGRLLDPAFAAGVVSGLVGEHEQLPPAYSAISVDGRRAYALAREGKEVEFTPRHVSITVAQLLAVVGDAEHPVWECAFEVSKGTYVRSIARDLGLSLGSAAHLQALRRTASGTVTLGACVTLDELDELGPQRVTERALDPVAALGLPLRRLSDGERASVANGRPIRLGQVIAADVTRPAGEGERVAVVAENLLLGVWKVSGGRLVCDVNFPQGISGVRI